MSTQTRAFQLSLLLHLALCGAILLGGHLLNKVTPPLVLDFSLALSEAVAGESNQSPGPPPAAAARKQVKKNASPTPQQPVSKPVSKPVRQPVYTTKPSPPQHIRASAKKMRVKPTPVVETGKNATLPGRTKQATHPAPAPVESSSADSSAGTTGTPRPEAVLVGRTATAAPAGSGTNGGKGNVRGGMHYDFDYVRRRIISNLRFPATARELGLTGRIEVSFIIRANGEVDHIMVVSSSGHDILDNTVIATIRRVAPFPRPPVSAQLCLPIVFHLN